MLVVPCGSPTLVSASGPDGAGQPETGQDGSTGHTGTKFPKGAIGEYTIVYEGQVNGLDFIVKNGDGHQHYAVASCTAETTTPDAAENPPGDTPTSSTPTSSTPDSSSPPASQPSQSGTDVGGTKQSQPGTTVLGEQLTQPETQPQTLGNNLPRTGLPLPALAPLGTVLLARGGLATALGRRPRG